MYFLVEDDDFLQKYNAIWYKVSGHTYLAVISLDFSLKKWKLLSASPFKRINFKLMFLGKIILKMYFLEMLFFREQFWKCIFLRIIFFEWIILKMYFLRVPSVTKLTVFIKGGWIKKLDTWATSKV